MKGKPKQSLFTPGAFDQVADIEQGSWEQLIVLDHADDAGFLDDIQDPTAITCIRDPDGTIEPGHNRDPVE